MKILVTALALAALSGCACEKSQHAQACRVVKSIVITSLVVSASVAVYDACDHGNGHRSAFDASLHDSHKPPCYMQPDGSCR